MSIAESPPFLNLCPEHKRKSASEYAGPCPFCGGTDRFIVFVNTNRAWCRQCQWKGDAIQLLRDLHGLSFFEAKRRLGLDTSTLPPAKRTAYAAHSFALRQAKEAFAQWENQTFHDLVEQYHRLDREKQIAEVAYRAMHRRIDLYSREERDFWTSRLASLYDKLTALDTHLDLLTLREFADDRVLWWTDEAKQGVQNVAA